MSTNEGVIIFSRVWCSHLVEIALKTARQKCPGCRVVYQHCKDSDLGWDDSVDITSQLIEEYDVLNGRRDEMFGPNDINFQKACIFRWKILLDWMEAEGVEEVVYCDSDVLLFDNPFKTPHYQPGRLHVSDNHVGCVHAGNSIVSIGHVRKMWQYMQEMMDDPNTINNTVRDLSPWTRLAFEIGFIDQNQTIDGVAWDHHMGCVKDEGGWEEDPEFPGYKRIQWIDQKPHCLHVPSGELVRLVNLHCWGDAEPNMPEYAKLGGVCL